MTYADRSALRLRGVSGSKRQRAAQRPHMSSRSAAAVINLRSGSPPLEGTPRFQPSSRCGPGRHRPSRFSTRMLAEHRLETSTQLTVLLRGRFVPRADDARQRSGWRRESRRPFVVGGVLERSLCAWPSPWRADNLRSSNRSAVLALRSYRRQSINTRFRA